MLLSENGADASVDSVQQTHRSGLFCNRERVNGAVCAIYAAPLHNIEVNYCRRDLFFNYSLIFPLNVKVAGSYFNPVTRQRATCAG